jgi:hypothetical protein
LKISLSYEKFVELMKPFNKFRDEKGKDIDLYFSGFLISMAGEQSPYFYYNFINDPDNPPKFFIYTAFMDNSSLKLTGIRIKNQVGLKKKN